MQQVQPYVTTEELMADYERFEDLYEQARRRADFKRTEKYLAVLKQLEKRLWPWMDENEK